MKKSLKAALLGLFVTSAAQAAPVTAVNEINLVQYSGTWYEIASIPPLFQRGCRCTTANYTILDTGNVQVYNTCTVASFPISATGVARVPNAADTAKLKVRFFGVAESDYWVLKIAPDYSYALVGTPDRKFAWILSRTRSMEKSVYEDLYATAKSQDFPVEKIKLTNQESCAQ